MHVCTLVGARPQFVKAAAVSPALKEAGIKETLIHSGQHYDTLLSQVFFEELGVPAPVSNLEAGSGSHAKQTGDIMVRLERFIEETGPYDAVIVYGDTNTTLAGALVAAKGNIPLAHVEAGIRSFNWLMPEEINRILTDRVSKWLFAPTEIAVENLNREGLAAQTILVGDVMLDATHMFAARAKERWPLESIDPSSPQGILPGNRTSSIQYRYPRKPSKYFQCLRGTTSTYYLTASSTNQGSTQGHNCSRQCGDSSSCQLPGDADAHLECASRTH